MTATSRKTARVALGTLLTNALVGTGKLAQAVYDHPPADIVESPVVFVRSSGTQTSRKGIGQTKGFLSFVMEIMVYVAAANDDSGWTPAAAANTLDDIEADIRNVILTNPTNAAWAHLKPGEMPSQIVRLSASDTGGLPYDVEVIQVECNVYDT